MTPRASWIKIDTMGGRDSHRPRLVALLLASAVFAGLASAPAAHGFQFLTKWGSFGAGDGQFFEQHGIAVDRVGNVYVADSDNHRIQKFTSAGAFITKWGSLGTGDGQFGDEPHGVATDAVGNVYVADSQNNRIQKFTSGGDFVTKWGAAGSGDGQFAFPTGVATDAAGNVYVADHNNHRIQKFSAGGTFITKWGGLGSGDGQFAFPRGIGVDADGNVYVGDSQNNRVQKFSSSGAFLAKWGMLGPFHGQLEKPIGIAPDTSGNVYVADSENNRVQRFTAAGAFLAVIGGTGTGDGQFDFPAGVATDCRGNLYVADTDNNRIQKFGEPGAPPPPCGPAPPPSPPPKPQCGDGADNDGDGVADAQDAGCRSGPADSYNPADDNEGDEGLRELVLCGRRAISLVRADVRGRRVVLSGLVASRFAGRRVQIHVSGSRAARRLGSVTANADGEFKASVPRPSQRLFNKVRYQARVGGSRSVKLKLPQSLESTSIRRSGASIVIRGKVKRALLGKRKAVVIRRLTCGRFTKVGQARPNRRGVYTARFPAPAAADAALYRAEAKVLARPGSKRYVRQFARAISIRVGTGTG